MARYRWGIKTLMNLLLRTKGGVGVEEAMNVSALENIIVTLRPSFASLAQMLRGLWECFCEMGLSGMERGNVLLCGLATSDDDYAFVGLWVL